MDEILHQLIGSLSHYLYLNLRFYTSQVVQDFVHQQYLIRNQLFNNIISLLKSGFQQDISFEIMENQAVQITT